MVTLRHAFDANSMKGLVLKILRGNYPAIPSTYSEDLKGIIADMLIKEPQKRPSMRKILEKPFLSNRISKLLTMTIACNEFSNTFVSNHLNPVSSQAQIEEEKKGEANGAANREQDSGNSSVVVAKQKITLSKDASRKKRRIEVIQNQHGASGNPHSAAGGQANAGEEDENGFVSRFFCVLIFCFHVVGWRSQGDTSNQRDRQPGEKQVFPEPRQQSVERLARPENQAPVRQRAREQGSECVKGSRVVVARLSHLGPGLPVV